jgi:predicted MPP superfamily phosphohydrolase
MGGTTFTGDLGRWFAFTFTFLPRHFAAVPECKLVVHPDDAASEAEVASGRLGDASSSHADVALGGIIVRRLPVASLPGAAAPGAPWPRAVGAEATAAIPAHVRPRVASVRIVCISDTHERLPWITVPSGDLLLHAGDLAFCGGRRGGAPEAAVTRAAAELARLRPQFRAMVCVAGNHDAAFERLGGARVREIMATAGVTYLQHSGAVLDTLGGLTVWGSPTTVRGHSPNASFQTHDEGELERAFSGAPVGVDILVTHQPPHGCPALERQLAVVRPRLHVSGHHHGYHGARLRRWTDSSTSSGEAVGGNCGAGVDPTARGAAASPEPDLSSQNAVDGASRVPTAAGAASTVCIFAAVVSNDALNWPTYPPLVYDLMLEAE